MTIIFTLVPWLWWNKKGTKYPCSPFTICYFNIAHLQETDLLIHTRLSTSEAEHIAVEVGAQQKYATL